MTDGTDGTLKPDGGINTSADRLGEYNGPDGVDLEVISPVQCRNCRNLLDQGRTCSAYPGGIPVAIRMNLRDHRRPQPGDHGITFSPLNDASAAIVAALFGDRVEDAEQ